MAKYYRILEFRNYDILLPFLCYECGNCCRNYTPQIYRDKIPKISEHLGWPEDELIKMHKVAYLSEPRKDCPFLTEENLCSIYPYRPSNCRLYPLETMLHNADVDCKGYKEFRRIWEKFAKGRQYFALRNPNDNLNKPLRTVPNQEWPKLLNIFFNCKPSSQMISKFMKIKGNFRDVVD